jgi:nitrate reductase NapE component
MAYSKDSGESKLKKNANSNDYTQKKNKSIFKNQSASQPEAKPQDRTDDIHDAPYGDTGNTGRYDSPEYESGEFRDFPEYERRDRQEESENRKDSITFMDVVAIVIANIAVPIVGGFVYYVAMTIKGNRQKAAHSVVLSIIVSVIRLIYIRSIF